MALLNKGDKVGLIAPSSCLEPKNLESGLAWLKNRGFEVVMFPHVYAHCGYMAGTDEERAADFNAAMADPQIKAVFCARGGAGSSRMLDQIDWETVKNNPKPIFGLSDSTALQNACFSRCGNVSYTGFLPTYDFKSGLLDALTEHSLEQIFAGKKQVCTGGKTLVKGRARGVLIGGCLSVLTYLCGTKYFPNLQDKILLLEDVGEKTYRVDLMLNQLRQQPGFSALKGIVFGQFLDCVETDPGDGRIEDILKAFSQDLEIPVMYQFPYGHVASRYILPIGLEVELDTDAGTLKTPAAKGNSGFAR